MEDGRDAEDTGSPACGRRQPARTGRRRRINSPPWIGLGTAALIALSWLAMAGHASPQSPAGASKPAASTHPADMAGATVARSAPPHATPWKAFTVHRGDTLSALFQRAGLSAAQLQAVVQLGGAARTLADLRPGERIRLQIGVHGKLRALQYRPDALTRVAVNRSGGALHATVDHLTPDRRLVMASGTVRRSLTTAMKQRGIDAATAAAVTHILHWRVNFRRDIRPGATFSVLYQKLYRDGRFIGNGPVVAVALTVGRRTVRAFRFNDGDGRARYFDKSGHSLTPSLLRTPLHYLRVSSPFSLHRFDPVAHVWRPHYGVDLAAPRGTPIKAAGYGVIKYMGWAAGYGNLVEMHNFGPYSTRYAHMLRFAKGLHDGSHVRQGQVIGYVGATGEATGPHLHFEIRVNGVAHNPLKMKLPDGTPIPRRERPRFRARIQPLLAALDHPHAGARHLADNHADTAPPGAGTRHQTVAAAEIGS